MQQLCIMSNVKATCMTGIDNSSPVYRASPPRATRWIISNEDNVAIVSRRVISGITFGAPNFRKRAKRNCLRGGSITLTIHVYVSEVC